MAHQADQQTMQLVLIRHGESEWNKLNLFTGWTDVAFRKFLFCSL